MREGGKEDMQLGTDLSNGLVSGLLSSAWCNLGAVSGSSGEKEDIISGDHSSRDSESINLLDCGFYAGLPIPLMKRGTLLFIFNVLANPLS